MKESTKKTLAVMNAEHRYIDANDETLKEFRIAINQLVDDDNMPEVLALIDKDRERAVLEGKMDLISWSLSRTSMSELKQRWKELEDELAQLSNPIQEKGKL